MATTKKFNTAYTLDGPDVYVTGNLNIAGTQTVINTANTTILDNQIVLNDGEIGAGVGNGAGTSGLIVSRGSLPASGLFYYEPFQRWILSNSNIADQSTFVNIATTTGSGTLSNVVDDASPQLGGNLDVQSFNIFTGNAATNITFNGNLQLNNRDVAPTLVANATVVYAATPAAGTSGVYVVNGSAANEELVTKRRAFGFSLIL
jgi:hypothetical protein